MVVNLGLGNGFVLSDNKPLPEPVLTEFYVPYGMASLGPNEFF